MLFAPILLGHFQAYWEAEIWYVDLTHKYKVIQGVKTKLNPFPQGGDLNLNFLFKGFKALKEAQILYVGYSEAKHWTPHPYPTHNT